MEKALADDTNLKSLPVIATSTLSNNVKSLPLVAAWTLMTAGAIARLLLYWRRPSLLEDEVSLAVNLVQRGYAALLSPLNFDQMAPVGFLWSEHAMTQIFGSSEYALRFLPLIFGLASMPLVWITALRLLGPWPAAFAAGWVSLSPDCIRYSNEAKQYGAELFVTAALLAVSSSSWVAERLTFAGTLFLAILGCVAILFSNPAIFVLAGIALLLLTNAHARRAPKAEWILPCALFGLWTALFAFLYLKFSAPHLGPGSYMDQFWHGSRLLDQSGPLASIGLILASLTGPFASLFGLPYPPLAVVVSLLVIAGTLLALFRRELICLALTPLVLPVLAGIAGRWIFAERLMFYSVPCTVLLMSTAVSPLVTRIRTPLSIAIGAVVAAGIWIYMLKADLYAIRHEIQSLREAVEFARASHRPGDVVYLYSRSVPAWLYYTTNWRVSDSGRAEWLEAASAISGPNGGNRQSRSQPVTHEGFDLVHPFDQGFELVGIGDGIFRSITGVPRRGPDPGWLENEFHRIRLSARSGRVIYLALSPDIGERIMLDYLVSSGARPVSQFKAPGAIAAVLEFPGD